MNAGALLAALVLSCRVGELAAQAGHPQHAPSVSGRSHPATHEDLQPPTLAPLPAGMSLDMIVSGDAIYHGKGTCFACHGAEGEGMPAAGDALTVALNYAQHDWRSIDSLIDRGIPQVLTRSPIQMPARGGRSDLTEEEVRRVAAYVWAISGTRGEPWPGGHAVHGRKSVDVITPTTIRTRPNSLAHASPRPAPSRRPR